MDQRVVRIVPMADRRVGPPELRTDDPDRPDETDDLDACEMPRVLGVVRLSVSAPRLGEAARLEEAARLGEALRLGAMLRLWAALRLTAASRLELIAPRDVVVRLAPPMLDREVLRSEAELDVPRLLELIVLRLELGAVRLVLGASRFEREDRSARLERDC